MHAVALQIGNAMGKPKLDAPEYSRARYLLTNLGLSVSLPAL